MRFHIPALGLAAATLIATLPSASVQAARFHDPSLQAPSLAESVACRTVRERVVRPNGSVVFRTKQSCAPVVMRGGCRMVRERVVRPGGAVVFRTVRRCG